MILLDSSVLIDFLRGSDRARAWLEGLSEVPVCSEVTRAEVLRGMRAGEHQATERMLQSLRWVPVDEEVSRLAGELGRELRNSHGGLSVADLLIAATARVLGAGLATSNVRHFPMFEGLEPPYSAR